MKAFLRTRHATDVLRRILRTKRSIARPKLVQKMMVERDVARFPSSLRRVMGRPCWRSSTQTWSRISRIRSGSTAKARAFCETLTTASSRRRFQLSRQGFSRGFRGRALFWRWEGRGISHDIDTLLSDGWEVLVTVTRSPIP